MDFVKVERPTVTHVNGGGRVAAPSEFQEGVNSLKVGSDETLAAFVPLNDGETVEQLEARITRSLVKAGKSHPDGACSVRRSFESSDSGTTVSFWLIPLIKRERAES